MTDINRSLHVVGLGGTLRPNSLSRRALEVALEAARNDGATTKLLAMDDLNLPMYVPGWDLGDYGAEVHRFIDMVRRADAMIWSTGAYHGTLAGVTKNALDFLQFLDNDEYLDGIPVGLIATAGGDIAAVNAINAMIHTAHALRATTIPLSVPIGKAWNVFDGDTLRESKIARRLETLGELVVSTARQLQDTRPPILAPARVSLSSALN
jgi:FMN reductase